MSAFFIGIILFVVIVIGILIYFIKRQQSQSHRSLREIPIPLERR